MLHLALDDLDVLQVPEPRQHVKPSTRGDAPLPAHARASAFPAANPSGSARDLFPLSILFLSHSPQRSVIGSLYSCTLEEPSRRRGGARRSPGDGEGRRDQDGHQVSAWPLAPARTPPTSSLGRGCLQMLGGGVMEKSQLGHNQELGRVPLSPRTGPQRYWRGEVGGAEV